MAWYNVTRAELLDQPNSFIDRHTGALLCSALVFAAQKSLAAKFLACSHTVALVIEGFEARARA